MKHEQLLKESEDFDIEFSNLLKEIDDEKNIVLNQFEREFQRCIDQIPLEILDMPVDEFMLFNDQLINNFQFLSDPIFDIKIFHDSY